MTEYKMKRYKTSSFTSVAYSRWWSAISQRKTIKSNRGHGYYRLQKSY